jgi:Tetratricopeptide repeat
VANHSSGSRDATNNAEAAGREAWILHLLAEIPVNGGTLDADEAERQYHESATLSRVLGMRPLLAHCHLGLGKLYRRTDKREQAEEHLATATTMYREMGMTYWLEKAEVELQALA